MPEPRVFKDEAPAQPAQPALQASTAEPFNPQAAEEREPVKVEANKIVETHLAANTPLARFATNTCTFQQAMDIRLQMAKTGKGSGVQPQHIQCDPNRYIEMINDHLSTVTTTEEDPF